MNATAGLPVLRRAVVTGATGLLGGNIVANAYAASKIRAEEIIRSFRENSAMRVPVIVPAWMWFRGRGLLPAR